MRHLLSFLLLFAFAGAALAQEDLPDRVEVGSGHMTIGFELKTTDKGDGPSNRSRAHSLMEFIIPSPGAPWSEAEREVVDRWSSLSKAERTTFFFENNRGGYNSSNFVVDTERFPYLDRSVAWYGSNLKIPHIEMRSMPYDSPREAFADMRRLRAQVPETIAFHVHMRFPGDGIVGKEAEAADFLRRTSWAIWMKRADIARSDFVMKQADNQPANAKEVDQLLERLSDPSRSGELLGRRGLRVQRLSGNLIDLEIRGLMKDVPRMERYLQAVARGFGSGEFGPWAHGEASPLRNERSLSRAFNREAPWREGDLRALNEEVEAAREKYGVTTRLSSAELSEAFGRLATADNEAGKRTLLPSAFDWLFLPLEADAALPEGIHEQIADNKKTYLRKLVRLAERVHAGEFGEPGSSSYRPQSVASRARRILHDFVNETYVDAGKRAKLYQWYETSLFQPEETVERTERFRRTQGRVEGLSRRVRGEREGRESVREGLPLRETVRTTARASATVSVEAEPRVEVRAETSGGLPTREFGRTGEAGIEAEAARDRSRESIGVAGRLGRSILDRAAERVRTRGRRGR